MTQTNATEFVDDGVGDFIADMSEDDWKSRYRDNGGGNASSLSFVKSPVVGGVVRHVLKVGVLHDFADVLCEKVRDVLKPYGLSPRLSKQEQEELRDALLWLGSKNQTREVLRFVSENGGYSTEFVKPLAKFEERNFIESEAKRRKVFCAGLRERRRQSAGGAELVARIVDDVRCPEGDYIGGTRCVSVRR